MAAELAPYGLRLDIVVVYRANAARNFAPDVAVALKAGEIDGVLHYSRRSTAIFVDCVRAAGAEAAAARLTHVCLSARASEPLVAINAKSIVVAQNNNGMMNWYLNDAGVGLRVRSEVAINDLEMLRATIGTGANTVGTSHSYP